jgi:hypothetical protein
MRTLNRHPRDNMSTNSSKPYAAAILAVTAWLAISQRTAASAPPSRYTVPMPGTVYDTRTKLTWQQTIDANSYTQSAAANHCTGSTLAGSGWRLPTRAELLTLIDPTLYDPAVDRTTFPNAPKSGDAYTTSAWFWTATPSAETPGWAWYINFYGGSSNISDVGSSYRVICVR